MAAVKRRRQHKGESTYTRQQHCRILQLFLWDGNTIGNFPLTLHAIIHLHSRAQINDSNVRRVPTISICT